MDTTKIKYDEQYIKDQYISGKSQKELASELGTYNTTIRRILIRNGVEVRPQHIARRTLARNPFDGSFDADYFLGYIAADGCVHSNSNRVSLCTNKDPQILEEYIKFLGVGKVLKYKNTTYNVMEYSVRVRDKEVHEYLQSLGLTPKKSLTLEYRGTWTWEFVRGVFDGDGSIFKTEGNLRFSIASGSKKFAMQLMKFLKDYRPTYTTYSGIHVIHVNRQEEIKKLHTKLYQNGNLFLNRKRCKFGLG